MKSKIAAKYIERTPYLQQFKNGVIHAVEIAEQEAERRYKAEIKSLLKAHIEDIHALSRKFDKVLDARLKAERDKAKDAFCNGCESLIPASCPCAAFDNFINRLSVNDPRDSFTSCLSDFQNSK